MSSSALSSRVVAFQRNWGLEGRDASAWGTCSVEQTSILSRDTIVASELFICTRIRGISTRRSLSVRLQLPSRSLLPLRRNMSTLKRKAATAAANDPKKPKKDSTLTSFFGQPKIIASSGNSSAAPETEGAASNFDKDKWVATLSDEQKDLLKLEIDTLDPTWLSHLKDDITKPSFLDLKRFLKREVDAGKTIFPPLEEVYSW